MTADIVTMTLAYADFKMSLKKYQNYYRSDREKPFCIAYINPKLRKIRQMFSQISDPES